MVSWPVCYTLKIFDVKNFRKQPDPRKQRKLIPSKISRYTVVISDRMIFPLQTEESLKKAKEKLEFCRDVMMIPRNLAGEHYSVLYFPSRIYMCMCT